MIKRGSYTEKGSLRWKMRKKRFKVIESMISPIIQQKKEVNILDIGGRENYWRLIDESLAPQCKITVINLEGRIPEDEVARDMGISFTTVVGDACNLTFEDKSFDFAHSNSVIEHVGSLQAMGKFASEVRRVANCYYVQTPYLWFPIDPHYGVPFIHWMPSVAKASRFSSKKVGFVAKAATYQDALAMADHTQLVDKTLMRALFPDAELKLEKFLGLTKSIMACKAPSA